MCHCCPGHKPNLLAPLCDIQYHAPHILSPPIQNPAPLIQYHAPLLKYHIPLLSPLLYPLLSSSIMLLSSPQVSHSSLLSSPLIQYHIPYLSPLIFYHAPLSSHLVSCSSSLLITMATAHSAILKVNRSKFRGIAISRE